jgi:hypothetical protein
MLRIRPNQALETASLAPWMDWVDRYRAARAPASQKVKPDMLEDEHARAKEKMAAAHRAIAVDRQARFLLSLPRMATPTLRPANAHE